MTILECLLEIIIISSFISLGAIAISGGRFSEATVSILVGSVECNGSESGLMECAHVTSRNEAVIQCDPGESAAVTCQGQFEVTSTLYQNFHKYFIILYVIERTTATV